MTELSHNQRFDSAPETLASRESVGLYLHFPYCRQRCSYCDFNAHLVPPDAERAYLDYHHAFLLDLGAQAPARVRTVFWGGGTPSLMPLPLLAEVVERLNSTFEWTPDFENTLEVNPGTLSERGFERLLELGLNRLSFGAQAFQPKLLEQVGRVHSAADIEITFQQARVAGFDNLSLDLIYGFPDQTLDQWKESLERSLALEPEHFSIYHLTVEPSTRLEKQLAQGELQMPSDDLRAEMDDVAIAVLSEAGFHRYEVSNWSRPGRECQHNLLYWSDVPYIGVGCGAVSYYDGWRTERIKPPVYYQKALATGRSPVNFAERRSQDGAVKDRLMMGLRIDRGVCLNELCQRFPGLERGQVETFFARLPSHWWRRIGDRFSLTRAGWDFHSEVCIELFSVMFSFS